MNTQTTGHTPGKLEASGDLVQTDTGLPIATCCQVGAAEANSRHLAHCWNCHEELLEALKHCMCYMEADADDDQERKDYAEARAALTKATRPQGKE